MPGVMDPKSDKKQFATITPQDGRNLMQGFNPQAAHTMQQKSVDFPNHMQTIKSSSGPIPPMKPHTQQLMDAQADFN